MILFFQGVIAATAKWIEKKQFVELKYSNTADGQLELSGTQIFGWDPREQHVKSWHFGSGGNFGQGVVTKADAQGFVLQMTKPDGSEGVTHKYIKTDSGWRWERTNGRSYKVDFTAVRK